MHVGFRAKANQQLESVQARAIPALCQLHQLAQVDEVEAQLDEMAKAVKRRRNELLEKERADEEERKMCKVCFANDACAVLLPCGHICVCEACALQLEDCPICKTPIEERKRVYHA
eukprot:CAMPEP_0113911372 /NCGR_PEP_ID=MMETSP0780_2-20120614/28164_1 /TAXON_ID=652834 /ORGANISM="Palpitomonas bilix" /LENGTH=115 /DNA_ID=CAMNT_0000907871 /DNA_START=206 /DNA_END=553 /DNA_ORIENTATION=+ /assembly_acc=CAM_ASM_000599